MSSDVEIATVAPPIAVRLRRHRRAKRFSLRYDAALDRLSLTIPTRASQAAALRWASSERAWIERQRGARQAGTPFADGAVIPFRDGSLTIVHGPDSPRRVARDGDRLVLGGPTDTVPRRIEQWLRRAALEHLSDDVAHYAALAKVSVAKVRVGDTRSRWGSCAVDGTLRFSWRLVCAPDAVRRYVAAHEVAHRVHMDHSPAFHALQDALFEGDTVAARDALRELGPGLQRLGR